LKLTGREERLRVVVDQAKSKAIGQITGIVRAARTPSKPAAKRPRPRVVGGERVRPRKPKREPSTLPALPISGALIGSTVYVEWGEVDGASDYEFRARPGRGRPKLRRFRGDILATQLPGFTEPVVDVRVTARRQKKRLARGTLTIERQ
jgi:hypothetical protein